MFFSPLSIAITSLGEERANLSAFCMFVRFALVWFCLFSLPQYLGRAAVYDCGTPWTFLLPFFTTNPMNDDLFLDSRSNCTFDSLILSSLGYSLFFGVFFIFYLFLFFFIYLFLFCFVLFTGKPTL